MVCNPYNRDRNTLPLGEDQRSLSLKYVRNASCPVCSVKTKGGRQTANYLDHYETLT